MVASFGIFRVSADNVLEHVSHLDIINGLRIQVEFREFLYNAKKTIMLIERLNFFFEFQFLKNSLNIC